MRPFNNNRIVQYQANPNQGDISTIVEGIAANGQQEQQPLQPTQAPGSMEQSGTAYERAKQA